MNIQLHIERLVLDGVEVDPSSGGMIQRTIEAELVRLIRTGGLADSLLSGGAMPILRAPEIVLSSPQPPVRLGTQVAHSVYRSIGQTERPEKDPTA